MHYNDNSTFGVWRSDILYACSVYSEAVMENKSPVCGSLSKDSIFISSQFMNFDDYYLLLSCFLTALLYPQIHFDWWLQLIGIK